MTKTQRGFTLIELVVVIVILGILAVTALPKFIDLSGEASQAAVDGVAGAISSAAAVNYAGYKASNGTKGVAMNNTSSVCTNAILGTLMQGGVPTGYTASDGAAPACGVGLSATCTITGQNSKVATASVACTN
ncbi:MAG TPA: type II secretion system protein [Methylococcaceae bacterium]|nr:type II secretion system protein [Methylococcaceae bacterium]